LLFIMTITENETNTTAEVAIKDRDTASIEKTGLRSIDLEDCLRQVDWTFSHRSKAPKIEAIHPYPAKFIGEIPAAFLRSLPIPSGTAVLDPFCGSGTTLIESQRRGLSAIGIDLNPIACLISRVKTTRLCLGFSEAVARLIAEAKDLVNVVTPNIPNIDHWFQRDVQLAVAALAQTLSSAEYAPWHDPLRLTLSSILVRVSNQDSDTRYAAVEKGLKREDVFLAFASSAKKLGEALSGRDWELTNCKVIEADIHNVTPQEVGLPVGMVITSPPYPNAYEYWLYHKYRMWWLGFDPLAVKEREIGARAHFFKKNHHTAEMFEGQMLATLSLVNGVLVSGGFVCVVVGRSKIHGAVIDNGEMIYALGQKLGLKPVVKLERMMNQSRKSFNLSHANIKSESVLVLQKQ
jgi:site-specific DNA-methyltransferase (cytosine-N4-specific)